MAPKHFLFASKIFYNFYLWGVIVVPYFLSKGFSVSQTYSLISYYSLANVVLEYPTGFIGDRYGHKKSIMLGLLLMGVSMGLFVVDSSLAYYYIVMTLLAAGASLRSGSDAALLKSISSNFTIDFANFKSLGFFMNFVGALCAGFLVTRGYEFAILVGAFNSFVGLVILSFLKNDKVIVSSSRDLVKETVKAFKSNPQVRILVFVGSLLSGFLFSSRYIFSTFGEVSEISIELIGVLVSLVLLVQAIGSKFGTKITEKSMNRFLWGTLLLFPLGLLYKNIYFFAILLYMGLFVTGAVTVYLTIRITDEVPESIRASTLSLMSLLLRLFSSGYILISGYILGVLDIYWILPFTGVVLLLALGVYSKSKK